MGTKLESAGGNDTDLLGRANIIFHGLMAFQECGDHYKVLIPVPQDTPHKAIYGNPLNASDRTKPAGGLMDLDDNSEYCVEGLRSCPGLSCQPPPHHTITLRNTLLEVQCEYVNVTIHVPKPDMIRGYRPVELRNTPLSDIAIDSSHWVVYRQPDLAYEVTVFSYFDPLGMASPILLERAPNESEWPFCGKSGAWNLCVYSEMDDKSMKETMDQGDLHSKLFNSMFKMRSRNGKLDDLNLRLYMQAGNTSVVADDAPNRIADRVGIQPIELGSLAELTYRENARLFEQYPHGNVHLTCSDPSGCGGAFLLDKLDVQ